jgi:hypothetical protein
MTEIMTAVGGRKLSEDEVTFKQWKEDIAALIRDGREAAAKRKIKQALDVFGRKSSMLEYFKELQNSLGSRMAFHDVVHYNPSGRIGGYWYGKSADIHRDYTKRAHHEELSGYIHDEANDILFEDLTVILNSPTTQIHPIKNWSRRSSVGSWPAAAYRIETDLYEYAGTSEGKPLLGFSETITHYLIMRRSQRQREAHDIFWYKAPENGQTFNADYFQIHELDENVGYFQTDRERLRDVEFVREIIAAKASTSAARMSDHEELLQLAKRVLNEYGAEYSAKNLDGLQFAVEITPGINNIVRLKRLDSEFWAEIGSEQYRLKDVIMIETPEGKRAFQISFSEMTHLYRKANEMPLDMMDFIEQRRQVQTIYLDGLVGTDELKLARLEVLVREALLMGDDVIVRLVGDDLLQEEALELANTLRKSGQARQIYGEHETLPEEFEKANEVHVMTYGTWEKRRQSLAEDTRYFISQDPESGSVHAYRPMLKMARAEGSLNELAASEAMIPILRAAYQTMTGLEFANDSEFVEFLKGALEADAIKKFAFPAILKVAIEDSIRLHRMAARLAEQAA